MSGNNNLTRPAEEFRGGLKKFSRRHQSVTFVPDSQPRRLRLFLGVDIGGNLFEVGIFLHLAVADQRQVDVHDALAVLFVDGADNGSFLGPLGVADFHIGIVH